MGNLIVAVGLTLFALGVHWWQGELSLKKGQAIATWIAGLITALTMIGAGLAAEGTIVASAVSTVGSLAGGTLALGLAGIFAIGMTLLVVIPPRWAKRAASQLTLIITGLIPLLAIHIPSAVALGVTYIGQGWTYVVAHIGASGGA